MTAAKRHKPRRRGERAVTPLSYRKRVEGYGPSIELHLKDALAGAQSVRDGARVLHTLAQLGRKSCPKPDKPDDLDRLPDWDDITYMAEQMFAHWASLHESLTSAGNLLKVLRTGAWPY